MVIFRRFLKTVQFNSGLSVCLATYMKGDQDSN